MGKAVQDFYHTSVALSNKIDAYTAVSDFVTLGIDLTNFDAPWSLQISRSLTTGTPLITIECSNNNTDWISYDPASTNAIIPDLFVDKTYQPRYMRVKYEANSATGTITMKLYK